jgi:protein involved in sex pheromone biosynthesis
MILHKEYWENPFIDEDKKESNKIKAIITFDKPKSRYVATILPVKISKSDGFIMEEFGAFTGFNIALLSEVKRQSKKQLSMAIQQVTTRKEEFINHFKPRL